jgi:hypothetical protein
VVPRPLRLQTAFVNGTTFLAIRGCVVTSVDWTIDAAAADGASALELFLVDWVVTGNSSIRVVSSDGRISGVHVRVVNMTAVAVVEAQDLARAAAG